MLKIFKLHQVVPSGFETVGSISIKSDGDLEEDLDEARRLTTSNGSPWYSNRTAYIIHTQARSIGFGDVLEDDGEFYLYTQLGWKNVEKTFTKAPNRL